MIPVHNLVHMLAYAWRDELPHVTRQALPSTPLHTVGEVLAWLFLLETKRLLRQGLDHDYVEFADELRLPRGRIDVDRTIARLLKPTQRLACVVDERDADVVVNQCLVATLHAIVLEHGTNALLHARAHDLRARFTDVRVVPLTNSLVAAALGERQHPRYRSALRLASLWLNRCMPTPRSASRPIAWPDANDVAMRALFQAFVRGFSQAWRLPGVTLAHKTEWSEFADAFGHVPGLWTDVSLHGAARDLVIECKFSGSCLSEHHGRSLYDPSHWRQLLVYVEQTRRNRKKPCVGVLLYAQNATQQPLRETVQVWDHVLRVETLDLAQEWSKVEADLREVVGSEWLGSPAAGAPERRSSRFS